MSIDPRLAPFVDAARDQVAEPTLSADDVFDAWDRRRRRRTSVLALSAVAAAAAAVAVLITNAPVPTSGVDTAVAITDAPARVDSAAEADPAPVLSLRLASQSAGQVPAEFARALQPAPALASALATTEVSTWSVAAAGYFASLESELRVDSSTTRRVDSRLRAEQLARRAESAMADGRRDEAIRLLDTLVSRYPASSSARSAMLDLGRLYEAAGRKDDARCIYAGFLDRWPHHSLRSEIDRRLSRLGDGPACR